jgi:hypothetical protein
MAALMVALSVVKMGLMKVVSLVETWDLKMAD